MCFPKNVSIKLKACYCLKGLGVLKNYNCSLLEISSLVEECKNYQVRQNTNGEATIIQFGKQKEK